MTEIIAGGARQGALTGLVYASVECAFVALVPWLTEPASHYHGVDWSFSAFLFVFYPFAGAVIMAALTALAEAWPRRARQAMTAAGTEALATLVLALLFGISNLRGNGFHVDTLVATGVAAAIALAAVASLSSASRRNGLRPFVHPFTASVLLVGQPWVVQELAPASYALKGGAGAAFVVTVATTAFLLLPRTRATSPRLVTATVAAILVLATSAWPEQTPRVNDALPSVSAAADLPHVVLVVWDTVRADHLSLYGYDRHTSPNLEALARDATVYTWSISASNMTLPSHASLFSGLYVRQHGAGNLSDRPQGNRLDDNIVTLAEFLAARGYHTAGVAANFPMLGHNYGLDQGFEFFDERAPVPLLASSRPHLIRERIRSVAAATLPVSITEVTYRDAREITASVVDTIATSREDGRPLFLFANHMDAHWPYNPPAPFDTRFPGKIEGYRSADYFALRRNVLALESPVTDRVREHLTSQYDGGIAYMDEMLGELMEYLRREGLYEESLIIITSDHGEAFGENGEINHGLSVAEHQIGVPLIIKYPGESRVGWSHAVVNTVDMFPTVLDALGMEIPEGLAGESLLASDASADRLVVSESYPEMSIRRIHPRFDHVERAVIFGDMKFVASTNGQMHLFDLRHDAGESRDLYPAHPNLLNFPVRLANWLDTHKPVEGSPVTLDTSTLQNLKALGYIH